MNKDEKYFEHEVRIRLLEELIEHVNARFDKLDNKMESQFYWTIGTIITLFGGVILHIAKLL